MRLEKRTGVDIPFERHAEHECVNCQNFLWVNDEGFCRSCFNAAHNNVKYVFEQRRVCLPCADEMVKYCSECNERVTFLYISGKCARCEYPFTGVQEGECVKCTRTRLLSVEGLCRDCFTSEKMRQRGLTPARCPTCGQHYDFRTGGCVRCGQPPKRQCINCENKFIPFEDTDRLCSTCMPKCLNCEAAFQRTDKQQVICGTCRARADKGYCVRCNDERRLDVNGFCGDCRNSLSPIFECINGCGTAQLEPGRVCNNCIVTPSKCRCGNSKPPTRYLCKDCMDR